MNPKPLSPLRRGPLSLLVWLATCANLAAQVVNVVEQGAHYNKVALVSTRLDEAGISLTETNFYVQLETGLNFRNAQGKWEEAKAEFVSENGWAVARKGQHQVALYHNLNAEGAVVMRTPDGKRLRSHVFGLAYFDTATGSSVLLAAVKDAQAQLTADNELVYPDAFTELEADVRYTYTKNGCEQDIILREQPPAPEKFGFNPETTRLEVWTEFVEAERPDKSPRTLNQEAVDQGKETPFVDEDLSFGELKIGRGRTFALGRENEALSMVAKNWIETADGRKFLVETVAVASVAAGLDQLPAGKGGAQLRNPRSGRLHAFQRAPARPETRESIQVSIPRMENSRNVAWLDTVRRPGLVLDYIATVPTLASYTFQSDETYYLSGDTTVTGAAVIEGGAVFKLNSATSSLTLGGTVSLDTSEFRPVIFTAKDDNSVGQTIAGSTGNPTLSYYGSTTGALVVQNGTATTLQHLRFSHQKQALRFASGTDYTIRHLQVSRCQEGLALVNTANIHNALFSSLDKVVAGTATTTVNGQHWTVNVANLLKGNPTATISLANSLMVQIATPPAGTFTDTTASVRIVASNPGVFQASGGGTHYLAAASPYRKSGTTAIDSTLAAHLKTMTTEAPVVMNTSVTTDTVLWRRGQRDVTATDLGYHYPAVDYLFKGVSLSAKLTISEGTVVAAAGSYGVRLQGNSQMLGTGRADAMNTLTRYTAVQESAMAADTGGSFFNIEAANWPRPILKLAFSRILTAGGYFTLLETGNLQPFNTLVLEHCQLRNIRLNVWPVDTSTVTVSLSNNLFERCSLSINKSYYSAYTPLALTARNNLFWRGSLSFSYDYNADGNITPWTFRDNLLDTVTNLLSGANGGPSYVYRSHNGFTAGTTSAFASGSTDKVNLTADYLPNGTRGNRYYPTTVSATSLSALIGAGSQTHAAAGLTYFTVKTAAFSHENQDNATVDIGYHYPGQDGNGKLLDSDQDGLADYREDVNNSGTLQAGETGHLLADSDGDGTDDGAELALGLNPLNPADGPKNQLALWRFNSQGTDRFYSEQGDVTVAGSAAVQEVNSWDGDAARVQLPGGYLGYAWRDASGRRLLNPTRGTVQFWFKPNWSSAPSGTPDGVATWRKLISVQAQGDEQEFWSLELNSQGNQLRFWNKTTSGNARPALTATVALNQHTWRLFTVTYDSTGVELWLDKTKVAFDNLTVGAWPSASAMPAAKVVWIGGWNSSVSPSPANGSFENVAFFNYRFNQARIEDGYHQVAVVDSDGDGLSDINELATHFLPLGSRFLPGNSDSDNDGLPDSWEYQHFPPPAGGGSWVNPGPNDNPDSDNLNNQPFTNFQEFLRGRNPKVSDADLVVSGEMPYWLVEDQSQLINLDFTLASRPQAVYGTPGNSGPTDDHAASVLISSAQTSVMPVAASADPNADHWNLIPPGVAHMSLATSVGTTSENQFKVGSWFGPITYVTTLVNGAEVICCDYYSASGPAQTPNPSYLPGGTGPSAPSDQTPPFGYVCPPSSYIIFVPVDGIIIATHGEPKPVAAGETHSSAVFDPLLPWLERYSRVIAHYPYCRPRYQAAPNPSSAGFGYDILGNLAEFPPSQACPGIKPTDNTTFTTAFRYGSAFYTGSGLTDATRHPMFNDYQIGKESDERTAFGAECKVAKEARSSVKLSAIPRGPWRVIVYSGAENHNRKATITIGEEKCYITGGDLHGNRFEKGRHYVQAVAEVDDSGIVDISFDDQSVINGVQLVKIVPPAEPQWDQGTGNPVTANAAGMIVRWLHTAGATAYELWRATGNAVGPTGTWTLVADNLRSRSFLDTGASAGVYNYYRLIAKNERFSSTGSSEPGVLMSVTLVGNRPPYLGSFKPVGPAWQGKRLVLSLPEVLAGAVVSDYEGSPVTFRIEGLLAGRLWVDGVEVTDSMLRQQANPPGTPATTHDPLKFSLAPGKLVEWEAPDGEADLVDALQLRAFDGALFSQTSVPLPVGIKPVLEVAWWGSRFQNTAGTGEWVDIQTATSRHLGLVYEWQNHAEWWSKFPAPIDGPDQNNTRLEDVVQLTSAMGVTLALKADGTVYSWGTASPLLGHNVVLPPNRPAWQLPWFESEPMLTPYQIWPLTGTARATQVAAGSAHAGLVTTDGKVYLWGEQTTYEAGKTTLGTLSLAEDRLVEGITVGAGWPYDPNDGWESRWATDSENQVAALPKPTLVRGLEGAVSMACSDYATAVLTSSGAVYDWGSLLYFDGVTTYYQYGSPQTFGFRHIVQSGTPQLRAMPQNKKVIQLAGGSQAFLALTADGEVYAWGANDSGAFADPAWVFAPLTATAGTDVPRKVPNLPTSIVQLAASGSYFAALTKEGAVFEWGYIGDQTIPKARPVRGLPRVTKLLLTWERAFAVDLDGKVWGWGRNRGGTGRWSEHAGLLLPDDHRLTIIDPVQLADLKNVQAISTATQYNLHASTERLPNAPQGLIAIGKEARIELGWQRFEGAAEYRIYASPTAAGAYVYKTSVRAGELTTQTWADTSIQNGQESFYKVSAVAKGTETPLSSFAWGRAVATPAFPGGSSLVITKLSRELQLRWCPASGALRYRIHRAGPFPSGQSTVTEADYRMLYLVDAGQLTPESSEHNGCNRLNYTDCALEVGKRYFYRIIPENTTGTGALQSANELVMEATEAYRPTAPSASSPFTYPADGKVQADFALTDTVGTKPGWVLRLFEIPGMTRGTGICPGVETLAPAVSDPGWRLTRSLVVGDSTAGNGAQWFFSVEEGTARRYLWFGQLHNGTWYKLVVTARDERGENAVAEDLTEVFKPTAPAAEAGAITDGFAQAGPGYIYLRYKSTADFSTTFIQQGGNCSYFMDYPWSDGSQITETWILNLGANSYTATVQPGGSTDINTDWDTGPLAVQTRSVTTPLNITNRVGDKMVRLSWKWDGYQDRIFYAERVSQPASAPDLPETDPSLNWQLIKEGRENVLRDTGLDNAYEYRYRLIALNPETGALDWEVTPWLQPKPSVLTPPTLTATAGNSAVKLVFTPGTAQTGLGMQWYSLFHQAGSSAPVELLSTFAPLPGGFSYVHEPLGNGSTHIYWAEVTYDSDEIYQTTPVPVTPAGDLPPFLPDGLRVRSFNLGNGNSRIILDWEEVPGARAYYVYSKLSGVCGPPFLTSKFSYEVTIPTANVAGTTFFVTAIGANGAESQVAGTPCTGGTFLASVVGQSGEQLGATPGDSVSVQSVVLTVPGGTSVVGPTNVTLRASVAISPGASGSPREVSRVEFYANQVLIGKSDQPPFVFDWHNPPATAAGSPHQLVAVAVTTAGGRQASLTNFLSVMLRPPLSEFNHSETDFELRGAGGSFPLTRVYRSGDTGFNLLGRGWRFNFEGAELTTGAAAWAELGKGWELKTAPGGLGSLFPVVQESAGSNHEIKVTLPDGQDLRFAAVVELPSQRGANMFQMQFLEHWELFADESEPATFATLRFVSVDGSDAALSIPGYPESIGVGGTRDQQANRLLLSVVGDFTPSVFVVTLADGSNYEFVPTVSANRMRLTRISDRSGNSFAFELYGSGSATPLTAGERWQTDVVKRIAIKAQKLNMDGSYATIRQCWIDDVSPTSNAEWMLYDPEVASGPASLTNPNWPFAAGTGTWPGVRYVTTAGLLSEVRKLNNRTSGAVDTHRYSYINFQSQDLLETIKSPEGVTLIKNTYALNSDGLIVLDYQEDAAGIKRDLQYATGAVTVPVMQGTTQLSTESLQYSADGQVTKTVSGGQTVENSYDDRGRLAYSAVRVDTTTVIPTTYDYDRQDRPVQVMDGNGQATRFEYTADSQPAKVTDARQNSTSYEYYSADWGQGYAGKLRRTVDADDNTTEYEYNLRGQIDSELRRLKGQASPLITRYDYYEDNASGNGRIGDLRRVYQPLSPACVSLSAPLPIALPAYATEYTYDRNGNRLTETVLRTTRLVSGSEVTKLENVTSVSSYDPQGRVLTAVRNRAWNIGIPPTSDVGQSATQYDALGRSKVATDGYNRQTTSTYDVRGNLIETQYPDGSVTRSVYDALRRVTMVQDRAVPVGNNTTASASETEYDSEGRVRFSRRRTDVVISKVADIGYLGYVVANPTQYKTTLVHPGLVFSVTRTEYDSVGRVRYQANALGVLTETFYDTLGRRSKVRVYDNYVCPLDTTAIPASPSATFYDTTYGYDEVGNVLWTRDAKLQVYSADVTKRTDYEYDALNRQVCVTSPSVTGVTDRAKRRTEYDSLGRVTAETAEDGVVTARRYDLMGRLITVINDWKSGTADNSQTFITRFAYDEVGNQITQTDAENRVTRYEYDWLGRRTYRALPGATLTTANMVESMAYAAVNAPGSTTIKVMQRSITDFAGKVTTFTHDILDRLATEQRPLIEITATPNITVTTARLLKHEYDPQGRRWRVQEFEGTSDTGTQLRDERFGYDKLGRLRVKAVPEGTLTYEYDVAGNPTLISARRSYVLPVNQPFAFEAVQASAVATTTAAVPNASEMVYRYDTLGRLWKVNSDTVPPVANTPADVTYAYDANGSLATQTYRNNVATAYTYNERNQLRLVRSTVSGALRATFDYDGADTATHLDTFASDRGLSLTGQRRQLSEKIGTVVNTNKYDYDSLRRLTREDRNEGATLTRFDAYGSYLGYDKVGNRRSKTVQLGAGAPTPTLQTFSALDRLTSTGFSFDAKGNTLTADLNGDGDSADANEPSADTNLGDRYDSLNRLVWAKRGSSTLEFAYDCDGNRVSKTVTPSTGRPVTTIYLVDTANPTGYAQVLAETPVTAPAPLNVVGEWRLDQRSGVQAIDTSGTSRHGTLTGSSLPRWTAGVASNSLTFATGGSVSVADQAALRLGTSFSIAFWVRKDAEPTQAVRLVGKGTSATANYGVWEEAGGKRVFLEFRRASDSTLQTAYSTANLEVGRWYHVACTYDGDKAKVYVNGIKGLDTTLTGTPLTGTEALTFGAGPNGDTLPGALDEVRIYSRVLVDAEVAQLAGLPATRYTYGLDLARQDRGPAVTGGAVETRYFGYDGLGSVRHLTDTAGTITDTYYYDAFGLMAARYARRTSDGAMLAFANPATETGPAGTTPVVNNYRYAGEQWDGDLGLYYNRARYYAPELGRFWSMDSFEGSPGDPLSLHKYLYCRNNPANFVDPSGLTETAVSQGALGGLVGFISRTGTSVAGRAASHIFRTYSWIMLNPIKTELALFLGTQVGAPIAAEVLDGFADSLDEINKAADANAKQFSPGPTTRGFQLEELGGIALERKGGQYLGGNVRGIDGTLAVDKHESLWQFKSHDLDEKALLSKIERTAKGLSEIDGKDIRGTTRSPGPGQPGFNYFRPGGSGATSKVFFVFVPEDQARMSVSPQFIAGIRRISEATRVVVIVRPTPGFKSSRR